MAEDDADGVVEQAGERISGLLTVLLTAAGRAAEEYARHRRSALEQTGRDTQARAAQLRARFDAERAAARAQLAATAEPGWWAAASPQQVADAWQAAVAWRDNDERITADAERLGEEIRRRYGVDPDELPSATREQAPTGPAVRAEGQKDAALAAALVTGEAEVEAGAVSAAGEQPGWDSVDARAQRAFAARASGAGTEAVRARIIGDLSQASPAAQAAIGQSPRQAGYPQRPARTAAATRGPDRGR